VAGNRAADQCRGNVVEEARQDRDDREQGETARPAVRQDRRHLVGNAAVLEVTRQDGEAHQQQEQVGERHRLVLQVQREAAQARAELEAGEDKLVENDGRKTGQGDLQCPVMKDGDARERQTEQDELDRDAEHVDRHHGSGPVSRFRRRCMCLLTGPVFHGPMEGSKFARAWTFCVNRQGMKLCHRGLACELQCLVGLFEMGGFPNAE
jgi:hypothetical protein